MKNLTKIVFFLACTFLFVACEQHVIEYDATEINDDTTAQFQIFYMVQQSSSGTANTINKIELNGQLLANETASLSPYSTVPRPTTGQFYTTDPGTVNLKLYKGEVDNLSLTYDQNFELTAGKYSVIVYDVDKAPIITEHQVPYPTITTEFTGTTAWVQFYNILHDSPGVPTELKLQYQYQYTIDNETGDKSDWINVGNPVSFGEGTGWQPVTVNKTIEVDSGSARVDYRIRIIGEDGSDQGNLTINRSGSMREYGDWWTARIGRVFQHMFVGNRTGSNTYYGRVRQIATL